MEILSVGIIVMVIVVRSLIGTFVFIKCGSRLYYWHALAIFIAHL